MGMRLAFIVPLLALLTHPSTDLTVSAQTTGSPTCLEYENRERTSPPSPAQVKAITDCLAGVVTILEGLRERPDSNDVTKQLIEQRLAYKRLKKWLPGRAAGVSGGETEEAQRAVALSRAQVDKTRTVLEATLRARKLFAKFSAVLISGVSAVDASQPKAKEGAPAEGVKTTDAESTAAQAVGTLIWRSRHFGEQALDKKGTEWSLGGRLGMQPVLNLVSSPPAANAAPGTAPTISAVHQNAFVWTFGAQGYKPIPAIDSELGLYASTGASTITTLPKPLGTGTGAVLAMPLADGVNRTAWLWETGLTFDIFDNALEQIHAEGGVVSPQFQALIAYRHDSRFSGSAFSAYKAPEHRLVFRLALDAIRVLDKRQLGEPSKTLTFGFVAERERGFPWLRGTPVPSALRVLLRGDLNLLNVVGGGQPAAKAETAPSLTWAVGTKADAVQQLAVGNAARVTVALNALTGPDRQGVKPTPPPTVAVTANTGGSFAVPVCPGASIALSLANGILHLTPTSWAGCGVTAVDLLVTPSEPSGGR